MMKLKLQNPCKRIKRKFRDVVVGTLAHGNWLQNHIAHCPRCRTRINRLGKVELALSLMKTQPHSLDLLTRANSKAINVLKHGLRTAPKAEELKNPANQKTQDEKYGRHLLPLSKTAACLGVILLLKLGVLSSISSFQEQGDCVVRHYYAKHLDQDYADELFSA